MSTPEHLHSVVTMLHPVVGGVSTDDLGTPTPCTDFDVRAVANHVLGTMQAMRRIGASEPMDPAAPGARGLAGARGARAGPPGATGAAAPGPARPPGPRGLGRRPTHGGPPRER